LTIKTLDASVHVGLGMQQNADSTYFVIANPNPWTDDDNPPEEDDNTSVLAGEIGYKRAKRLSLARPLTEEETPNSVPYATVTYKNQDWALIPNDEAYEQGARWLYAEADIYPDDLPSGEYRQVGLRTNLQPQEGITKPNLLPSEITDRGTLLFYENRVKQTRVSNVYALEQFVIKV